MKYMNNPIVAMLAGIIFFLISIIEIQYIYGEENFYNPFKDVGKIVILICYVVVILVVIIKNRTTEK